MKLYSVKGNQQSLDGGSMFGNAPRVVWEKWLTPDEKHRITLQCRCLLVQTKNDNILFETGVGSFFSPKMRSRFGVIEDRHMLIENLNKIGLNAKDISKVVLSHLHFDHAGGLLSSYKEGVEPSLAFENATIYTSKTAYERSIAPHARDRASFIKDLEPLIRDRVVLISEPTHTDLPMCDFYFSDGHTPGQLHSLIKTPDSKSFFFCGDIIPGTAWVHLPITMGYDRFPELVIDEKKKFLDLAIKDSWDLFFTHDPVISTAKVKRSESGRYEAHQKVETLA